MSSGLDERANGAVPEHGPPDAATNGRGPGDSSPATAEGNGHAALGSRLRAVFGPLNRRARPADPRSRLTRDEATAWSSWEDLRQELDRSRRYGHCFTIVRVACPRSETRSRGELGRRHQAELNEERVRALVSILRGVDRVWAHGENIYVLLPECDREMAEAMLARIRRPLSELSQGGEVSLACFPEDGVASGALHAALYGLSVRPQQPVLQAAEGGEAPRGTAA